MVRSVRIRYVAAVRLLWSPIVCHWIYAGTIKVMLLYYVYTKTIAHY